MIHLIIFRYYFMCYLWIYCGYWKITSPPCSQDAHVSKSCTDCLIITPVIKRISEQKKKRRKRKKSFFFSFVALREKFNYNLGCMLALRRKKNPGDKWIYRANDKTWGGITDRWKDRGCAANRQNAPVQSRAHLWEQEFVLLHFSRVASPVDLQKKKGG